MLGGMRRYKVLRQAAAKPWSATSFKAGVVLAQQVYSNVLDGRNNGVGRRAAVGGWVAGEVQVVVLREWVLR